MEEWRDIKGFEGKYQVSNQGRIKSLARIAITGNYKSKRVLKEIIKKTSFVGEYEIVTLHKNSKPHTFLIHRIEWIAFMGEIPEGYEIDHIVPIRNGGTNELSNLRLVTHQQNCHNPISIVNIKQSQNNRTQGKKKILQFTRDGVFVKEYDCISNAALSVNGYVSNISACCRGRYKSSYGFIWRFKKEVA